MNDIGKKIKELRKKNDLTQEKLADFLGVTYQSVSKWETGSTYPDLSMIVPLTRVLHVSADELLGVDDAEADARRAEFDERCDNYWKYEEEESYQMAQKAVSEYPSDYKYLKWLAQAEYFMAFDDKYREEDPLPYSPKMIDSSIKHYNMVIEGSKYPRLVESALWGAMIAYRYTGRFEEALKYVNKFPKKRPITRDQALDVCLQGEEQLAHRQKMASDALSDFCMALMEIYRFATCKTPDIMAALNTTEAVLRTIFPDGNYLNFTWQMCCIYEKRAELELRAGDHDKAMEYLSKARDHAMAYSSLCDGGVYHHTCEVFDRYEVDLTNNDFDKPFWERVKEEMMTEKLYLPLRDREDFKALFQ